MADAQAVRAAVAAAPRDDRAAAAPAVAARRRRGPHALAVAVLVLGLAVTAGLSFVTLRDYHRGEQRLLSLQTTLTGDAIAAADPLYVEDHLGGAASLAAATGGDTAVFRKAMSGTVGGKGPFASASLWRVTGGTPRMLARIGGTPLLAPASARAADFISRATRSATFVVTEITGPGALRIGYAAAASGPDGTFVAYCEEPLPPSRRITEPPSSPISQLNLAVYLGRSQTSAALLETDSAVPLPLRGITFTKTIPFGNTVLTLTTSPRSPLTGTTADLLPWLIAAGGALLTLAAALLTERLACRRDTAERLTEQITGMYVEQRSVAQTLQHALLPESTPAIAGMATSARYFPGVSGVDVGGDWFDIVPLDRERFAFIVGDVSGRGVGAARVMASLHHASRAYAVEGHPPAAILGHLRPLLDLARDGSFATVLCGLADVRAHEVTLASAGHPPPLVLGEGGASFAAIRPGPPIGVAGHACYEHCVVKIPARGTLVAYTDGLIERRGEILDAGMERLAAAAARDPAALEDLLDRVVADLTGDSPDDDIALIGLRWLR